MKIVRGFIPAVDHFTSVPNEWARDNRLSYRARGILVTLLSHREGWHSSVEAIAREGAEGRDAVRTAIHELEAVGYLIRERGRDEQRKYTGGTYLIKSPCESIDGFSASGKATSDNPSHKKTNSKKTNEVPGASEDAPARLDYPEDFETFWSHYPKRQGPNPKKAAYGKWKTAIKTTDPQAIVNAVKTYASSELPADRQMIPQAATWLSQERWEEQDTTAPDEWLKDCWRKGDTASITERTGLIYGGVVWPDVIPSAAEERAAICLQQARAWIEANHDRIVGRMSHAV